VPPGTVPGTIAPSRLSVTRRLSDSAFGDMYGRTMMRGKPLVCRCDGSTGTN
jgi:hypothetical protein